MTRTKTIIAAFVVTVALSAAVPGSGLAASWFVNGTKLAVGQTVKLANTAQLVEPLILTSPSLGVKITCTGKIVHSEGEYIAGPTAAFAKSQTYEGCSEIQPTTCRVQSTIKTEALTQLVYEAILWGLIWLKHTSGKEAITTLTFEGTCALSGEQPLRGMFGLKATSVQSEAVEHTIEGLGTAENNSLELGKGKVYVEKGETALKLESGLKWSFH